ncbi:O-fucosyltransferase 1-like isoform X2 [Cornus florida]|uniref:O-fucosyltransferase 1-like isoform X2 n=1 Tax=Cornus florida TaxID=4283 RepID=UPI00289CAB65|nr:O-fucosyltransferase 1-like isoform X2 [Cornus florida]
MPPQSSDWYRDTGGHCTTKWLESVLITLITPPGDSNGYLVMHCYGGMYRHRSEISDAVIAARALNATLVVPRLGAEFEFRRIYMVSHFINSLRYDVKIVEVIPQGNITDPYKVCPPKVLRLGWLTKVALPKLRKHEVIIISHLKVATEDAELQRLRCRVSFHALRFTSPITSLGNELVDTLQRMGYFIAMHVHVESDALVLSPTEDLATKRIFGRGYERDELYILGTSPILAHASVLPDYGRVSIGP